MEESRRSHLLIASFALLTPLLVEQSGILLAAQVAGIAGKLFWMTNIFGILLMLISSYTKRPVISSGLFFGGLLTVVKNYHTSWAVLDTAVKLWTLSIGMAIIVSLILHKKSSPQKAIATTPAKKAAPARRARA